MGSTNPLNATHTHWAAAGENMVFIEFLTGLGQLPPKGAFFLFAPTKIVGGHGGNGRAVGVLP
jgi:kynurenine formamidase